MTSKLVPMEDRIVVRKEEVKERQVGGIFLPQTAASGERYAIGEVLSVGPGRQSDWGIRLAVTIHVGDRVVFNKHSGVEVEMGVERYIVLRQDEVIARVEDVQ